MSSLQWTGETEKAFQDAYVLIHTTLVTQGKGEEEGEKDRV